MLLHRKNFCDASARRSRVLSFYTYTWFLSGLRRSALRSPVWWRGATGTGFFGRDMVGECSRDQGHRARRTAPRAMPHSTKSCVVFLLRFYDDTHRNEVVHVLKLPSGLTHPAVCGMGRLSTRTATSKSSASSTLIASAAVGPRLRIAASSCFLTGLASFLFLFSFLAPIFERHAAPAPCIAEGGHYRRYLR